MTPREELLAAVAELDRQIARQPEACAYSKWSEPEYPVIRDWLQLEAAQHLKWDPAYDSEWLAGQPCIQMARLINGTGEA